MSDCIFCKIVRGEIPCTKVYEDEYTLAFKDINPKAPVHVLVIPKEHVADIVGMAHNERLMTQVIFAVDQVTKILGVQENGFRTIANTGRDSGQIVDHFHFHILAGKQFGEDF